MGGISRPSLDNKTTTTHTHTHTHNPVIPDDSSANAPLGMKREAKKARRARPAQTRSARPGTGPSTVAVISDPITNGPTPLVTSLTADVTPANK